VPTPVSHVDKIAAVQEASALLRLVQETSDPSGPVPDAVSKAQMALGTLIHVLAEVAHHTPPEGSPDVSL